MLSVYDSFLPAVRQWGEVGVEERELSGNKGGIVRGHKTVSCGCQENKVVVKPIRDGPFSS